MGTVLGTTYADANIRASLLVHETLFLLSPTDMREGLLLVSDFAVCRDAYELARCIIQLESGEVDVL